ncbi:PDZ domain-containing protein [Streptomyces sp. NPDC020607]|uniref:PDZ domain-containing protein n=1 Tax=Streptomyces sp. NPDC020607 TaxID=3365082 RepID=UPI0037A5CE8F
MTTLLSGVVCAAALVLSGIGIGTVGATVIGMSKLAGMRKAAPGGSAGPAGPGAAAPGSVAPLTGPEQHAPSPGGHLPPHPPATALGIEAVDAPQRTGALLVGVHVSGPGHAAGLVRGDTVLVVGGTRIDSATELAAVVGAARPGRTVTLTVRHAGGTRQVLAARPGVVT